MSPFHTTKLLLVTSLYCSLPFTIFCLYLSYNNFKLFNKKINVYSAGYVIEKQLNTTNKWFKVATLEPTVMKYCVENLKEKSEYFFKIYAENCIGLSQPVETKLVSLLTHASKYT